MTTAKEAHLAESSGTEVDSSVSKSRLTLSVLETLIQQACVVLACAPCCRHAMGIGMMRISGQPPSPLKACLPLCSASL